MTEKMALQTVFFDLDGTLIDTEQAAARVLRETFHEWNIPISHEDADRVTGVTWEKALQFLFTRYAPPIPSDDATHLILARYHAVLRDHLPEVPGAREAVRSLSKYVRLAVVSGSHHHTIEWALKQLGILQYFEFVLGAEDYPQSKPAPDGYLKGLKMMGADPATSLVFEDSFAGITSSKAAGIKVVALRATNYLNQDQSKADYFIHDLRDVSDAWIRSHFSVSERP